ncbi:MAG TPA: hypothetical protein VK181_25575 [Rhizobium sp.]|nr:hypothetical protein [Rhizobium sp.]
MEIILLAAAIGGIYSLWKLLARIRFEKVRAFVFLEALRRGDLNSEANQHTAFAPSNVVPSMAEAARVYQHKMYSGKLFPIIGEAYLRGMVPSITSLVAHVIYNVAKSEPVKFVPVRRSSRLGVSETSYETYFGEYIKQISLLSKRAPSEFLELLYSLDDEPCRRAFQQGVTPKTIAELFTRHHGLTVQASAAT